MDVTRLNPACDAAAGADMTLCHPVTGEALPVTMTLMGADAPEYARVLRGQLDRKLTGEAPTAETLAADHIERLVGMTKDWRGLKYEGRAFAFSPNNARKLYQEQAWIRDQVQRFIERRDNFFLSKANSSSIGRWGKLRRWWAVITGVKPFATW